MSPCPRVVRARARTSHDLGLQLSCCESVAKPTGGRSSGRRAGRQRDPALDGPRSSVKVHRVELQSLVGACQIPQVRQTGAREVSGPSLPKTVTNPGDRTAKEDRDQRDVEATCAEDGVRLEVDFDDGAEEISRGLNGSDSATPSRPAGPRTSGHVRRTPRPVLLEEIATQRSPQSLWVRLHVASKADMRLQRTESLRQWQVLGLANGAAHHPLWRETHRVFAWLHAVTVMNRTSLRAVV
jgi:hypothetical protein